MDQEVDILGIGCCSVDYLSVIPTPLQPDAKLRMKRFSRQGGGLVATALVTAQRLGASTQFIGKVSDDPVGSEILEGLAREGVDASLSVVEPGRETRFALILVDESTGRRSIVWTPGTVTPLQWEELDPSLPTRCRLLHIDEYELGASLRAAKQARSANVFVSLDAETVEEETPELLANVDLVIGSQDFARQYTGCSDPEEAVRSLHKQGPRIAGVTLGSEGSVFCEGSDVFFQEAFQVRVVDTTGAGDVFHGAFAFAVLKGWSTRACAVFSSAVAAMKCMDLGGRQAIPTLPAVRLFLEERNHLLPE